MEDLEPLDNIKLRRLQKMIYEKIKELCKKNQMSVAELESKLGFSNGTVGKWKVSSPKFCVEVKLSKIRILVIRKRFKKHLDSLSRCFLNDKHLKYL